MRHFYKRLTLGNIALNIPNLYSNTQENVILYAIRKVTLIIARVLHFLKAVMEPIGYSNNLNQRPRQRRISGNHTEDTSIQMCQTSPVLFKEGSKGSSIMPPSRVPMLPLQYIIKTKE